MWFKVCDKSTFHRKIVAAGNAAVGAWVRMGALCSLQESDGYIDDATARIIASDEELTKLREAGLIEPASGGFVIHDFLRYNPTHKQLASKRKSALKRMQSVRANKTRTPREQNANASPPDTKNFRLPDPTRPDPLNTNTTAPREPTGRRGARLPDPWEPDGAVREWARANAPDVDLAQALAEFCDHWHAVPGQRGTKLDWGKTFRNRLRELQGRASQTRLRAAPWRPAETPKPKLTEEQRELIAMLDCKPLRGAAQ